MKIKKHAKNIKSIKVTIERIEISLFFFIIPRITPKIDITAISDKIVVKPN
ncbi:hypothetical protein GCM10008904_00420 [Paraclostridium ghonii]|uniref:Uncharacterized protein n=1 Tax=Paraclostridium ghonii TaxID=29358 RepID=A0ABU0MY70_9FIRM|nr:hypothetical protein [Paeniclostridium ghonii]MDQ0555855.1 hypothetical protein [Paeniclostridium ghonii]